MKGTDPGRQGIGASEATSASNAQPLTPAELDRHLYANAGPGALDAGADVKKGRTTALPTRQPVGSFLNVPTEVKGAVLPESVLYSVRELDGLIQRESDEFVRGTLAAIGHFIVQKFAMLHGVYPVYVFFEYAFAASRWQAMVEGRGQAEVRAPIPLGHGIELDLSVHLGGRAGGSEPPVTLCALPSGTDTFGAVAFGDLMIAPGRAESDDAGDPQIGNPELKDRMAIVPIRLTVPLPHDARTRASAARWIAERDLMPHLLHSSAVQKAGIDVVVAHDSQAGVAMWVCLNEAEHSARRVVLSLDAVGQLGVDVMG